MIATWPNPMVEPTPSSMIQIDIAANLAAVKARLAAAARAASRSPGEITLVAVSKTHGPGAICRAITAGHTVFGENRVQEALDKWPALKEERAELRLHLIGPLQRNKARRALALFDVIETVDRLALARTLARDMEEESRRPDVLIQVNTGSEPQKAGVLPQEADRFIRSCLDELALPVKGLMCIPPMDEDPAPHFAALREMAQRNGLRELSMGMTADFEAAVRHGATIVRVGTAIFGARSPVQ